MPRTASLQGLSLTDLQHAIRDRQRAVAKLERKRAKLQRKLDDVERRIAAVAGSRRGGRGGPGSRPRNEASLPEAIARVLSQAGAPMNVGDITKKVQAGGYRSGSAKFRAIVNQALIKDKRFKSAGRGVYQFDGAAAAGAPPRRRRTAKAKK